MVAITTRGIVVPTLFLVDPYGYPLAVPILQKLLTIPKAELLVNLIRISPVKHPGYLEATYTATTAAISRIYARAKNRGVLSYRA